MSRPGGEIRRAARALGADRLKAGAFEAAPDPTLISDHDGRVLDGNAAAKRLFGRVAGEGPGAFLANVLGVATPFVPGDASLDADRVVLVEARRSDGESFPAEVAIHRFRVGSRVYVASRVRDLTLEGSTPQRLAEREGLQEAERALATASLLAGVAHELNNPLAVLLAQSTLLRDKAPTADVERRAAKIEAAARRAGRIVRSFVAMAQRKAPVLAPLDLDDALDDALDLLAHGLDGADIAIARTRGAGLPRVDGDRDLLGQVFNHVLMDAQASLLGRREDRRVSIQAGLEDGRLVVAIGDNGASLVPDSAGGGVGLSLCRSILDEHGGTLSVDVSPEGGRLVRVSLPPRVTISDATQPRAVSPGMDILVVDDESEVAQSLAELIEIFGHRVFVETSADAALRRIAQQRFDGIFTDLRMPGLDGVGLRQAIAERDPALAARTVIVTGDGVSMALDREHLCVSSATLSLEKPFTAADVKAALDRIMAP